MQLKNLCAITTMVMFVSFSACKSDAGPGGKIWFFTNHTGASEQHDTILTPANFIYLDKDGSYSSDLGGYDYGKWVYANNQLLFISHLHSKSALPVSYLTSNEMQTGSAKGPFNNFEATTVAFTAASENPFSKDNNQWRIKAAGKETDAQLKNRLLNHFKFWEIYFTWALNDKVQYIDVRSTPTPIKIYGNGFGLKPYDQLPREWVQYFYDEEDCRKANEKIKYLFDNNAVAWPHTENKYKMFLSAFQQLQQKLQ